MDRVPGCTVHFSFASDIISRFASNPETWVVVAFYTMAGGFTGALGVALPGLIDLLSLANARAKQIALTQMSLNLLVVGLYAANLWLRFTGTGKHDAAFWLSAAAIIVLAVSGWPGAEMAHRHGVGVDLQQGSTSSPAGVKHGAKIASDITSSVPTKIRHACFPNPLFAISPQRLERQDLQQKV